MAAARRRVGTHRAVGDGERAGRLLLQHRHHVPQQSGRVGGAGAMDLHADVLIHGGGHGADVAREGAQLGRHPGLPLGADDARAGHRVTDDPLLRSAKLDAVDAVGSSNDPRLREPHQAVVLGQLVLHLPKGHPHLGVAHRGSHLR